LFIPCANFPFDTASFPVSAELVLKLSTDKQVGGKWRTVVQKETVIEKLFFDIVRETQEMFFQRIRKNIYVTSREENMRITINSNTYRIITVDKLNKTKKI